MKGHDAAVAAAAGGAVRGGGSGEDSIAGKGDGVREHPKAGRSLR